MHPDDPTTLPRKASVPTRVAALVVALLAAAGSAFIAVVALSFTGWSNEERAIELFVHDLPFLVVALCAAVLGGVALATGIFGDRRTAIWVGAALGGLPVLLHAAAYFTDRL